MGFRSATGVVAITEPVNRWEYWYARIVPAWIRRFLPERRRQTGWRGPRRVGFLGVRAQPRLYLPHGPVRQSRLLRKLIASLRPRGPAPA